MYGSDNNADIILKQQYITDFTVVADCVKSQVWYHFYIQFS